MIKIPDIIEAMEQRDAETLERMLVEHVEHFVDRLREETMKKFWLGAIVEPLGHLPSPNTHKRWVIFTHGTLEGLLKKMNIEHRTSNIECWMGKDEETEIDI